MLKCLAAGRRAGRGNHTDPCYMKAGPPRPGPQKTRSLSRCYEILPAEDSCQSFPASLGFQTVRTLIRPESRLIYSSDTRSDMMSGDTNFYLQRRHVLQFFQKFVLFYFVIKSLRDPERQLPAQPHLSSCWRKAAVLQLCVSSNVPATFQQCSGNVLAMFLHVLLTT